MSHSTRQPAFPDDPHAVLELCRSLDDDALHHLAESVRQVQIERGVDAGDLEAVITQGFEVGFGRDGLGVSPWVEGNLVVCPGAIISKSRTSHRCRFVSVDEVWVWDSSLLMREDKRSLPGADDGFRAVALIPLVDGTALDVVSGKQRSGGHQVERVVSFEVRGGELVEVSQRDVAAMHAR